MVSLESASLSEKGHKLIHPGPLAHGSEDEGSRLGVGAHLLQIDLDIRGKFDLVDHQCVRFQQRRSFFARDIGAHADIDHIDRQIDKLGVESGGQIVAT